MPKIRMCQALTVLTFLPPQTGPRPGHEGFSIWPLWEKCPKGPQDEPWCLHTDGTAAGLLQVRGWKDCRATRTCWMHSFIVSLDGSHCPSCCPGRMYKQCCATYESASLRMFRLGRTDTIRSASSASAAFVKAFDDPNKQVWLGGGFSDFTNIVTAISCNHLLSFVSLMNTLVETVSEPQSSCWSEDPFFL